MTANIRPSNSATDDRPAAETNENISTASCSNSLHHLCCSPCDSQAHVHSDALVHSLHTGTDEQRRRYLALQSLRRPLECCNAAPTAADFFGGRDSCRAPAGEPCQVCFCWL